MWPFKRGTPEERFWLWFKNNSARVFHFEDNRERVFDELSQALRAVDEGLTFEVGRVRDGKREFVVSADGIRDRFPAVRRLVDAAPALPEWVITPFRPPASLGLVIEYGGITLGPDDVWFAAEPDHGRVGLTLYVKGLTEENESTLGSAGYILLDNALGEFAVETQVGFVEWKPLPANPGGEGLAPFRTIRDAIDRVAH